MVTHLLTVSLVGVLSVAGSLGDCNVACPEIFQPVCADCNGEMKTFSNTCKMQRHNQCNNAWCELQHYGQCNMNCNIACTRNYNPICSWNGRKLKTFSNKCTQNAFNKCYKDSYSTIANCPCESGGASRSC